MPASVLWAVDKGRSHRPDFVLASDDDAARVLCPGARRITRVQPGARVAFTRPGEFGVRHGRVVDAPCWSSMLWIEIESQTEASDRRVPILTSDVLDVMEF